MEKNIKFIYSLNAIRGLAFIAVFTSHAMWTKCQATWGGWGVSAFLILSGFLMFYRYFSDEKIENTGIIKNSCFVFKKMKKLWSLHIITTIFTVPFISISKKVLMQFVVIFVGNIFMIQEWLPFRQAGMLNGGGILVFMHSCFYLFFISLDYKIYEEKLVCKKI